VPFGGPPVSLATADTTLGPLGADDHEVPKTHRRPGPTLYRYVAREMAFPTFYALGGMTLVVLTKELLGFSDLVINRGLGIGVVGTIAGLISLPLAANMLPFAVMVGALVALGRLGADRELLVLEASGLSVQRLVGPVLAFAGAMTVLSVAMSLWIGPWASRSLDARLLAMAKEHPSALILPGTVHEFGQWKLTAREVSADGRSMAGVALWFPRFGQTIFAERASIVDESGGSSLHLEHGVVVLDPRGKPRELRFDSMTTELPASTENDFERSDNDQLTGKTLAELRELGESQDLSRRNRLEAVIALHRRFAMPFATLVFGLLALPLFLARGQQSRAAGALLGVAATVVYYGLVQMGDALVMAELVSVPVGAWLPNVLMIGLAGFLLMRSGRVSSFARQRSGGGRLSSSWEAQEKEQEQEREQAAAEASQREEEAEREPAPLRPRRFALQRYVSSRFAQMILLAFGTLLAAYLLVDVLERLQWFARYEATPSQAIRFYGARIPLLASRVLPMSLLVGTALTVALLAVQGELTGIRACGIPAARALFPVIVICALLVPGAFLLNDEIVPRTNAIADYLKQTEIKGQVQQPPQTTSTLDRDRQKQVWFGSGRRHFEADVFDPQQGTAQGLTVYDLGDDGLPVRRIEIGKARQFEPGRWRLQDAVTLDIKPDGIVRTKSEKVLSLGEEVPAEVDTKSLSVGQLRDEIRQVEEGGWAATQLRVDLHVKYAAPFACLVLPALVLFFCVSGPPYPTTGTSLVVSGAIAVAWVLLTGVSASLGYGGLLPAPVAGWAPTLGFAVAALVAGLRLRLGR